MKWCGIVGCNDKAYSDEKLGSPLPFSVCKKHWLEVTPPCACHGIVWPNLAELEKHLAEGRQRFTNQAAPKTRGFKQRLMELLR